MGSRELNKDQPVLLYIFLNSDKWHPWFSGALVEDSYQLFSQLFFSGPRFRENHCKVKSEYIVSDFGAAGKQTTSTSMALYKREEEDE